MAVFISEKGKRIVPLIKAVWAAVVRARWLLNRRGAFN
jgi:hypothetical protein